MVKVALVDDEQIILNGLQRVIAWADYGCEVVGTAVDGAAGIALVQRERPDILITDIRMPNMDGLTMLAALRSEHPDMQVAILTAFRDFEYAQSAIRLGVVRYLLKPSKMDELSEAITYMVPRVGAAREALPEDEKPEAHGEAEASMFVVNAALRYIEQHFAEHIRLSDVADSVYVSQWHLSKLINRHLGKSFFDILGETRVEEAKRLMPDPALKVHEIADRVGFSDVAHFSKVFKRVVGQSPAAYRAREDRD